MPRPCPYLGCRYHLIPTALSDSEVLSRLTSARATCSLDVADLGGTSVRELAEILGDTENEIELVSSRAISKLREALSGYNR